MTARTQGTTLFRNATIFDGTGSPPLVGDCAMHNGAVIFCGPTYHGQADTVIDATGLWLTPGFFDIHTHYDAELEAMPGLEESVRHGVTTVVIGNCSLSAVYGSDKEIVDLFCRVECLPRKVMERWLLGKKSWHDAKSYHEHLASLALGPNVATMLGHSNVRIAVMGLKRALSVHRPEEADLVAMQRLVEEAMEAGYLGLSIDMLPWHRMDGEEFRGVSVPSQHAHISEYKRLANVVRRYRRVLQATPNALNKKTVLQLLGLSVGGLRRDTLKTTIVAALDVATDRKIYRIALAFSSIVNNMFGGNVRFQALAEPFLNFADGVETPLFEEFPTGVQAISARAQERRDLFKDKTFRERFTKDWSNKRGVFHRDLARMEVVASGKPGYVGKSFAELAATAGKDPVEFFMDELAEQDTELRWKTVVANDRDNPRLALLSSDNMLPGFNDSGAHNRNMAYHDGALRFLKQVKANPSALPMERAIAKLTKETADWLGIEGGHIAAGAKADLVLLDPTHFDEAWDGPVESYDERLGGAMRLVKRQDGLVRKVFIAGKEAYADGAFASDLGKTAYGKLLKAGNA